ncbi:hypothetical protein BDN72DRAFT_824422 [Pluteus cervinus]|uniref:Uncharacterized protein n=1 Tax=Pluteus cervinus TaxID=181527 RepID=A0ACD3AI72_9AGAR|nr:hypothetical protein BDN72DRAFT_824422 [Pluteus cervinus]
MGPTRTQPSHRKHSQPGGSRQHHTKRNQNGTDSALPGVQKIKSSLRQAQRLLAKDNLAADVRVETERRVKSLEGDLAKAERSRKERTFATKYHKVKFFERQKVTRKITQTKKQLEDLGSGKSDKKKRKALAKQLVELRVDLNYILHYPRLKKYVSLFPPEVREGEGEASPSQSVDTSSTDAQRQEVREWIRGRMEKGELPENPEEAGRGSSSNDGEDVWEEKDPKDEKTEEVGEAEDEDAFFGEDDDR